MLSPEEVLGMQLTPVLTSSKSELISPIYYPRWRMVYIFESAYLSNEGGSEEIVKGVIKQFS